MGYIAVFDFMNRIDEARFFLFDQTQCPVQCLPYHPPSPPPADPSPQVSALPRHITTASPHPQHSPDTSIEETLYIIDGDTSDTDLETAETNVQQSPAGNLRAKDEGLHPMTRSFVSSKGEGLVALQRIPTTFVRRNIKYSEQPSHCVLKIPFVGEIESRLTWGKRGYADEVCINEFWPQLEQSFRFVKDVYLEILIEERGRDDDGIVLQVMVFNANGTLCQPNVRGV
ncbi:hypothetical protein ACFE04_021116 [Oxalis oulophora]